MNFARFEEGTCPADLGGDVRPVIRDYGASGDDDEFKMKALAAGLKSVRRTAHGQASISAAYRSSEIESTMVMAASGGGDSSRLKETCEVRDYGGGS
ncbi:hypothetical protein OROGR_011407 [Orobanche gracilis]